MVWEKSKDSLFFVKSLFDELEGGSAFPFPRKIIWNSCIHTEVFIFPFNRGIVVEKSGDIGLA